MVSRSFVQALVTLVAGCGRLGFATHDGSMSAADAAPDGAVECASVVPSPTRRYAFDGSYVDSSTAIGDDATPVGNPQFVAGKFGQALRLDGIGGRAQIDNLLALDYSVAFWVRTTASAPGQPTDPWFVGIGIVDAEVCGNPPTGDWGVALVNGGRVVGSFAASTTMVNDGAWHAILHTRTGALDTLEIYVDGVLEGTADANSDGLIHDALPFIGIGANPCTWNVGPYFAGDIDELLFYDRVLTASDATELVACAP